MEYEFITWSDRYNIGHSKIDEEHKELVKIVNNLHRDAVMTKKNEGTPLVFKDTIKGLISYINFHFSHEERLMNLFNYPKKYSHKAKHDKFISKVLEKYELYKEEPRLVISQLLTYLREWILEHIAIEDKEMMLYIINYVKNNHNSNDFQY